MELALGSQARVLFTRTAAAAQEAQNALDAQQVVLSRSYAMPRVTVDAIFHVTERKGKTAFIFGERSEQEHKNQLSFALHLAPRPMDTVTLVDALPSIPVFLPPFVVTPELQKTLVETLKLRLRAADAKLYRRELEKIDAATASRRGDSGFICLAINETGRYLMARVGGDNDGIFLLDLRDPVEFEVYSYLGMDRGPLPWRIFHELFAALRLWQRTQLPGVESVTQQPPERFGAIEVRDFATEIWNGYRTAREQLASSSMGPSETAYFELRHISALLNFSVPSSEGGSPETIPFIRTQATIAIDDESLARPRMPVRLIAPEFVLVTDARDRLLDLLDEHLKLDASNERSLLSKISEIYRSDYQRAFADRARRSEALTLLSYRDPPPRNEFIFVWTGMIDEEEREFAFVMRYDGSKLRDPELVFPMEHPISDSITGIPVPQRPFRDAVVSYGPRHAGLHNFFHTVWIWYLSGVWF